MKTIALRTRSAGMWNGRALTQPRRHAASCYYETNEGSANP